MPLLQVLQVLQLVQVLQLLQLVRGQRDGRVSRPKRSCDCRDHARQRTARRRGVELQDSPDNRPTFARDKSERKQGLGPVGLEAFEDKLAGDVVHVIAGHLQRMLSC